MERIGRYYDLPRDPTAIARTVDYLLERDRFICSPRGYEVSVYQLTSPATTNAYGLDPASNKLIPHTLDPRGNMGKVLQGQENAWDCET